jgi:hypothetical protein
VKSDLRIFSNLMLDDADHKEHHRWMPGDLVGVIYKEFVNPEFMHRTLTPRQQPEYLQYFAVPPLWAIMRWHVRQATDPSR